VLVGGGGGGGGGWPTLLAAKHIDRGLGGSDSPCGLYGEEQDRRSTIA